MQRHCACERALDHIRHLAAITPRVETEITGWGAFALLLMHGLQDKIGRTDIMRHCPQVWTLVPSGASCDRLPVDLPGCRSGADTTGMLTDVVAKVDWVPGKAVHAVLAPGMSGQPASLMMSADS